MPGARGPPEACPRTRPRPGRPRNRSRASMRSSVGRSRPSAAAARSVDGRTRAWHPPVPTTSRGSR
ncbi:hypothetical protein ADK60_03600 [Streptomyces sp. XY431]|nr:hypothetical protein ADK60_03600 [Streptomyces sp. XY431]